jgi:uncharacterized membrane protein
MMKRSTYNLHRSLAGVFLAVGLFAGVNYYFDLGFFGRGAKGVLVLILLLFVIYGGFFAPTRQDMREYRDPAKKP